MVASYLPHLLQAVATEKPMIAHTQCGRHGEDEEVVSPRRSRSIGTRSKFGKRALGVFRVSRSVSAGAASASSSTGSIDGSKAPGEALIMQRSTSWNWNNHLEERAYSGGGAAQTGPFRSGVNCEVRGGPDVLLDWE
jgi:hypothetical protein